MNFEIKEKILKKKNILMLSNEIALIEKMEEYSRYFDNIIIVLSRNLSPFQIEEIKKNVSTYRVS